MTKSNRARGHLKHATWCSCGKVVHGNGARAAHRKMHERKKDGHHAMIWLEWERRFRTPTHDIDEDGSPLNADNDPDS